MKLTLLNAKKQMAKRNRTVHKAALLGSALLFLCGSLIAGSMAPQQTKYAKHTGEIRNYAVVWPGKMMRSGKPYSSDGWTWLHQQGVRSVVTLIRGDNVDYKKFGFENILQIPLKGQDVPTEGQAQQYLQFIQDPKDWPVDVHCSEGKDRTGMMVALARYAIDGWPMEKALAEAKTYRGGEDLAQFRVEWLKKWAAEHKPGSERRPVTNGTVDTHAQ